ncbi:MAG: signal peptidase II [Dehalococcoidia bacterium]
MDDATAEHAPDRTHRLISRLVRFLLVAGLVVLLDQVTKAAVRGSLSPGDAWPEGWEVIRIVHIRNTGAAFGILQGAGDFLIIAPLIAIAAIAFFLLTMPARSRWYSIALSAILGGAVGNLIDRIRLGSVTDFIDPIYYPWSFNLADSAIVLGIIAIVVLSFFEPAAVEREEADVADGAEVPR